MFLVHHSAQRPHWAQLPVSLALGPRATATAVTVAVAALAANTHHRNICIRIDENSDKIILGKRYLGVYQEYTWHTSIMPVIYSDGKLEGYPVSSIMIYLVS